jgi:hypothetical protein
VEYPEPKGRIREPKNFEGQATSRIDRPEERNTRKKKGDPDTMPVGGTKKEEPPSHQSRRDTRPKNDQQKQNQA